MISLGATAQSNYFKYTLQPGAKPYDPPETNPDVAAQGGRKAHR